MNPFITQNNDRISIDSLKASIIEEIIINGALEDGDRLPSLRTLTESLSTNHVTLMKAVKLLTDIGILKTCEKKGIYLENRSKCSLLIPKNAIVGAILPYSKPGNGYYFDEIASFVESKLKADGIRLIVQNINWTGGDINLAIDDFSKYYRAGALLIRLPEGFTDKTAIDRALLRGVKVILIDSKIVDSSIPSISVDNVAGGLTATQHLIDRGHRRIAFLRNSLADSPKSSQIEADRFEGYKQALAINKISITDSFDLKPRSALFSDNLLINHLFAQKVTAVFAYNDENGYNLVNYLQRNNIKVPEEISVIGFDNVSLYSHFKLTSIDPIRALMAETAVKWIYSDAAEKRIVINPILSEGNSVCSIKDNEL
ncbi:MAG: substrate-binding domain-containing protein [Fibrobacteres bacterium]|nr:substrate-binding domain-containing protein [Fibrobacterota bacterium]